MLEGEYLESYKNLKITVSSSSVMIVSLIIFGAGNITRSEASTLLENIEKHTISGIFGKCMFLEAGSEWFYPTAGFNHDNENSAVGIFSQVQCSIKEEHVVLVVSYIKIYFAATVCLSYLKANNTIVQVKRDTPRSNVLVELIFTFIAKEQHFNQLRTVEQLG